MYSVRIFVLFIGPVAFATAISSTPAQNAKPEWITLNGQVLMSKPPETRTVEVNNDKMHCLKDGPLLSTEFLVNPKSKGVKNVVVWLQPARNVPFPANQIKPELAKVEPKTIVVDQPCCQFIPRVFAARTGDKLVIKNSAPVAHNINYTSDVESFNVIIQPGKQHEAQQALSAQGFPIPFKCDLHPWMAGKARVFDHPYFAVTDDDGKFEIKDAPAGKWRIFYWQEAGFHGGKSGRDGYEVDVRGPTVDLKPIDLDLGPPKP